MQVTKIIPKNTTSGDFLGAMFDMKTEILQKGYNKPFVLESNLELQRQSGLGEHFYSQIGVTERDRMEQKSYILTWIINRELDNNILVLRTTTKEEARQYHIDRIKRKIINIDSILKNIQEHLKELS